MKIIGVALIAAALSILSPPIGHAALLSDSDKSVLSQAFDLAGHGKLEQARRAAETASDSLLKDVLTWQHYLQPRSGASFAEISEFIFMRPDWPQMLLLRRRAEEAITASTPAPELLGFFQRLPPITVDGKMAMAKALRAAGRADEAKTIAREAWINGTFGVLQERNFVSTFQDYLDQEHHIARLDRLLWDHDIDAARRMVLRVDSDHKLLAQARFALITRAANPNAAISKVPRSLQDDPGLIHDRLRWRRQADLDDGAAELLDHKSANLGRPDKWWTERAILTRRFLAMGHVSKAYKIAANHALTEGADFAEAEWLAGWISLRFLNDGRQAFQHFQRLFEGVNFPISKSRGAYWAGRAAEAMGDKEMALKWYRQAAEYLTTFYGQLAAAQLGEEQNWMLPADPLPAPDEIAVFEKSELVRIVRLFDEIGHGQQSASFLYRLNENFDTPGLKALVAGLAGQVGRQDVAVTIAKRSDRVGIPLIASAFPIPEVQVEQPEPALVFGLIRQESGFNPTIVSSAGAVGMMQILPDTAKQVAKGLGLSYSRADLDDPDINVRLGSAYLARLLGRYDGSYILSLAAYNAGPGRVSRWLKELGDPRQPGIDPVDWIESIPFNETRNYVQRVLEGTQVYRGRMGQTGFVHSLELDLRR